MDCPGQGSVGSETTDSLGPSPEEKKTVAAGPAPRDPLGLKEHFEALFDLARPAFQQQRTFERAKRLASAIPLCLGRHTVTGMLCASGQQFQDWSAAYRLFEQERIDIDRLFHAVIQGTLETLPENAPLVGAIDDTLIKKKGRRIQGASWRRDPLGPSFVNNLIWASRFLQISLALPETGSAPAPARMIPVDLTHCPTPRKPGKRGSEEQWKQWEKLMTPKRISSQGVRRIAALRSALDRQGQQQRQLVMTADATFTCRAVFKALPDRTTLIGRIRKDARLYALPTPRQQNPGRGRNRAYGDLLPTPEQMRQEANLPWIEAQAHAAGKLHTFRLKDISPLRWKSAGAGFDLRLIIIAPLGYRLRKGARKYYRKPAYLITTDLQSPVEQLLQAYLWRWEIEVNFRDEKTLLGMGEAQVRTRPSVETLTAFVAGVYAMLLLAQEKAGGHRRLLCPPRWQRRMFNLSSSPQRTSTAQMLREFRFELWAKAWSNKSPFVTPPLHSPSPPKLENTAFHALFYASQ